VADHESDVYTKNREWVSEKSVGARPDFDEWANHVVAAVKTHRSRFGASAGSGSCGDESKRAGDIKPAMMRD
jgi:hypothetical protein